ncbi:hypothetical protein B0J14DRAFT_664000 [Halenospora varia]|nr:hypothetical protein B0J14DRAFT_664000 [Halenospora varia]
MEHGSPHDLIARSWPGISGATRIQVAIFGAFQFTMVLVVLASYCFRIKALSLWRIHRGITFSRLLIHFNYLFALIFTLAVVITTFAWGQNTVKSCTLAIELCVACHLGDKVLVYLFLCERIRSAREELTPRYDDLLWQRLSFGMLTIFGQITLTAFFYQVRSMADGYCMIGFPQFLTITLLVCHTMFGVIISGTIDHIRYKHYSPEIRRTLPVSTIILASTVAVFAVLQYSHGLEKAWLYLMLCSIDMTIVICAITYLLGRPTPSEMLRSTDDDETQGLKLPSTSPGPHHHFPTARPPSLEVWCQATVHQKTTYEEPTQSSQTPSFHQPSLRRVSRHSSLRTRARTMSASTVGSPGSNYSFPAGAYLTNPDGSVNLGQQPLPPNSPILTSPRGSVRSRCPTRRSSVFTLSSRSPIASRFLELHHPNVEYPDRRGSYEMGVLSGDEVDEGDILYHHV